MYTSHALLDISDHAQQSFSRLLAHCGELNSEELNREIPGFGYPSVRLQLHHVLGAQKYWIGVLQGRIDAEENDSDYPTVASLETYRQEVSSLTEAYLRSASKDELSTARTMLTWGNKERVLTPAHIFMRTVAHLYHHQGQVLAMCRLLGKPGGGMDYPIA